MLNKTKFYFFTSIPKLLVTPKTPLINPAHINPIKKPKNIQVAALVILFSIILYLGSLPKFKYPNPNPIIPQSNIVIIFFNLYISIYF